MNYELKPRKITPLGNGHYKVEQELFYTDVTYFDKEDRQLCGDMGFAFCEQPDTRNDNSYEENVGNLIDSAESCIEEDWVEEDSIPIWEVCVDTFADEVWGDEDETVEEIVDNNFVYYGAEWQGENETLFRIALCSKEEADKYELEKYVGHIDKYVA